MASTDRRLASWQDGPCPPWCDLPHHDDDHPDDRRHRGAAVYVSVSSPDPGTTTWDLVVFADQVPGRPPSVRVQQREGPRGVPLSVEGAARLRDALDRTVGRLGLGV